MYEEYIKQLHIEAKLRNLADSSIKTYTDFTALKGKIFSHKIYLFTANLKQIE